MQRLLQRMHADTAGTVILDGDVDIEVSDNITHTEANTLNGKTTGVVTATLSTTAIGDLDDLAGTGNAYTITVNTASVTAAALKTVNDATTVNVTATAVTAIAGSASDLASVYGGGITGLGNENVTVNNADVTADHLNTINAGTSVNVLQQQ